mmetsp:Transcript_8347/g.13066  ORF Transcript_8347/g.13066 Transcript_8347/m.13066 type:complete len:287 (+) Transcript_8347:253-1113(+)
MGRHFDVTYEEVNIEIIFSPWFAQGKSLRLTLDRYVPTFIMVGSLFLYCVLYKIVFPKTRPKTAAEIERTLRMRAAHNFSLCVYSAICCIGCTTYLLLDGQLFDWHRLLCTPVESTVLRPLSVTFTLSKLWEWWDTAFIVWLGSRPPEFLHLYHHATTFWLFCFVMNLPGAEKFGMMLNGGVHMLMYSHYWRSWPKALVPAITVLQIAQLAFVTYAYTVNPSECPAAPFTTGPQKHFLEFVTAYGMVPVFLAFFINFFVKRFILGSKSSHISNNKKNIDAKKSKKS